MNLTGTITGAAVTGLTSPTMTLVADSAPAPNGKQGVVTTLGGTQTGATVHSTASPYFVAAFKPQQLKRLGAIDPSTGQLRQFPKNTFSHVFGKGCLPLAGQPVQTTIIRVQIDVPAGADLADVVQLRTLVSFMGGYFWAKGDEVMDQIVRNLI